MNQDDDDPFFGKGDTVRRHLRGARRFEERKQNLLERKKRGHGPPSRMRDLGGDDDDEEWYDDAPRRGRGGSNSARRREAEPNARVSEVARTEVRVLDLDGHERTARLSPSVLALGGVVVGDDVEVDDHDRVTARAERRTVLERRAPGKGQANRVLAANVDVGLVVLAPRDDGLSLGFLDRAIVALESGGIEPCVVVTKVDLVATDERRVELERLLEPWRTAGVAVYWTSSPTGEGVDALREDLGGRVAVVLGHSGVGKSTLINALDPDAAQSTGAVRESDGRGRHTTTASRLIPFLDGGALVDTPGVRQLAPDVTDVRELARSIPELAPYLDRCRYGDCAHVGEPGCRVAEAAEEDAGVAAALQRLQRLVATSSE